MQPVGQWVLPQARRASSATKKPYWHWVHKQESTTYCGVRRPQEPEEIESRWNPLIRACKKCLERISREGY